MSIFRLALLSLVFMSLLMLVIRLLIWRARPHTRPCNWFGHDKKYLAIRQTGCVAANHPNACGRDFPCDHKHKIGEEGIYIARWSCRRCPVMAEECFGNKQDWKVEHEQVIPDEKRWTNWSKDPAAQKTKPEAKKEVPPPNAGAGIPGEIKVKAEVVKGPNYCNTCGWNHTGPCLPGAIS